MTIYEVKYKLGSDNLKSAGCYKNSISASRMAEQICNSGKANKINVFTYIIVKRC